MTPPPAEQRVLVGSGHYRFAAVVDWPTLPSGWNLVEATAVAVDPAGRIVVFNRGEHPIVILDPQGQVVGHWGEGCFVRPHGITITEGGDVWLTDDADHTVRRYTLDGELRQTLGVSGQPSDTGATSIDYRTIRRSAGPFYFPTNVAAGPDGDLFISDGYGNARIHRFSPDGRLRWSWGEPGSGPGQFHVPHGVAVDRSGIVYVADRENSRIQRFDGHGRYLDEWTDVARPCQVFIDAAGVVYVAELGYRAGMWPGTSPPAPDATGGRVSIFDRDGRRLARWGGGLDPFAPGDFFAPHDIWVDREGTVYVAEVTWSAGGRQGLVPADCPSLRKYVRVPEAV